MEYFHGKPGAEKRTGISNPTSNFTGIQEIVNIYGSGVWSIYKAKYVESSGKAI